MDYSLPGSSVHGIFQARVLEWVAISFSRGSSQPRDRTQGPYKYKCSRPKESKLNFASFINKFHLNISHGEKINVKKNIGIQFTNISIY